MEPGSTASNPSPEMGGYNPNQAAAKSGESSGVAAEQPKQIPELHETQPAPTGVSPQVPAPLPQLPQVPAPQPPISQLSVPDDAQNPMIAADEDVVEKEWVDKAKKIVAQTKDDPYAQEKEVSKLQADYLKKRYGKDIKITND